MTREQGFGRIQDALLGGEMGGVQPDSLEPAPDRRFPVALMERAFEF
jgi:hypothetical protein